VSGRPTDGDLVRRNSPELYWHYMRANPLYFEGLWRVAFNERNLNNAVRTMFPGTLYVREIMANIKAICTNCNRGPMTVRGGMCLTHAIEP
jgi:hypothetical protein